MLPTFEVPGSGRGHAYTEAEIQAVVDVMRGTEGLTQGKHRDKFEKDFSERFGLKHAFAVSSATSALELSATLAQIKPGDEVIIPAHTFAASALPFAKRGAKLVWADIDPKTFVTSAKYIEPLITPKTKVIIPVHLYGLPCAMDEIMTLAKKHNILVVEDVAQAIGARYKGKLAGSFGELSCYSFHAAKNITTLGEGGILGVNDSELAKVVPGFRHNGMRRYPEPREAYWQPAMTQVDFDWENVWPNNFCIGEAQCALGSKLIERVDSMNADRAKRAKRFQDELKDFPEIEFQHVPTDCSHAYHLLVGRFKGPEYGKSRDEFYKLVAFEFGIQVDARYMPLYRYPIFSRSGHVAGTGARATPNCDAFYDNMVSFPFYHWMPEAQFTYMIDSTKQALKALREKWA